MKIKISCDSTADLSPELISRYDIGVVPLVIVRGEESLRDGVDITPEDIFDYVDSGRGVCITGAVNVEEYAGFFREYLREYDAVIHINISSGFSACHQNATIAASEFPNVYTVDSRNLSTGSGHLVLDAVNLAQGWLAPPDIKAELDRRALLVEASFVIDTLKYLHKGGRCSALAALGANMLRLKPCIEVKNGLMDVGKKYRGALAKCVREYVSDRLRGRDDIDYRRIFITHTRIAPEIVEDALRIIADCGPFEEVLVTTANCTVSNHCGPGTLGLFYIRKDM